ncbi:MAG: hypothetical protein V9G12_18075 [Microthrixaceae bacterium]
MQAVVDWFGPTDFALMDTQAGEAGNKCTSPEEHNPTSSPESTYVGAAIQTALTRGAAGEAVLQYQKRPARGARRRHAATASPRTSSPATPHISHPIRRPRRPQLT